MEGWDFFKKTLLEHDQKMHDFYDPGKKKTGMTKNCCYGNQTHFLHYCDNNYHPCREFSMDWTCVCGVHGIVSTVLYINTNKSTI